MSLYSRSSFHALASTAALFALSFEVGCAPEESNLVSGSQSSSLDAIAHPVNIDTSDLDGDGRPDIAVGQFVGFKLSLRLNKGDGTFYDAVRYASGIQPVFIDAQDFNGDGKRDVAVSNFGSGNVSVFIGQGAGTFAPAQYYSLSDPTRLVLGLAAGATQVTSGDFNHDGKLDLATCNGITNNISSLGGRGDGTFKAAKTFSLIGPGSLGGVPSAVGSGDFDEDGDLDLVTSTVEGLVVMRGHGDGTFDAYASYHSGLVLSCLRIADFNADGHLDVATTAIGSSNFAILLGNGHGAFTLSQSELSGGLASECFGVGDLNGDGKLDLTLVNTLSIQGDSNLVVRLGRGDGTFGAGMSYPVGTASWAASVADFNGDGNADVAVANGINTSVSILFGHGDGTLQPQTMYPM